MTMIITVSSFAPPLRAASARRAIGQACRWRPGTRPRERDPERTVDERKRQVAHDAGREAVEHQAPLAKTAYEGAKQEALQNDPEQTEVGERVADLLGIERLSGVGEAAFGKECEAIDVGREGEVEDKNLHQQAAQARRHKVLTINTECEEAF